MCTWGRGDFWHRWTGCTCYSDGDSQKAVRFWQMFAFIMMIWYFIHWFYCLTQMTCPTRNCGEHLTHKQWVCKCESWTTHGPEFLLPCISLAFIYFHCVADVQPYIKISIEITCFCSVFFSFDWLRKVLWWTCWINFFKKMFIMLHIISALKGCKENVKMTSHNIILALKLLINARCLHWMTIYKASYCVP